MYIVIPWQANSVDQQKLTMTFKDLTPCCCIHIEYVIKLNGFKFIEAIYTTIRFRQTDNTLRKQLQRAMILASCIMFTCMIS